MNAELRMSNGELEWKLPGATDKLCLSVLNRVR